MDRVALAKELLKIAALYWDTNQRPLDGKRLGYIRKCAELMHLPWQMIAARPAQSAVLLKAMDAGKKPEEAIQDYKKHNQQYASMVAASAYVLTRDAKTKHAEFKSGERLQVKEYKQLEGRAVWIVKLEADDGRKLAWPCESAHKALRGFPKPPSESVMERWSDDGVAKAVDGARVEPDGMSPAGAPSWLLVMGVI